MHIYIYHPTSCAARYVCVNELVRSANPFQQEVYQAGPAVREGGAEWLALPPSHHHPLNHPPTLYGDVDGQGAVNRRNVATITMQWTVKHTHESNIQHPISPVVIIADEGTHPTHPNQRFGGALGAQSIRPCVARALRTVGMLSQPPSL